MNLTDFYTDLSYGPLSNLAIGNSGAGGISDASKAKIVYHLNNGLKNLYGRFILKENEQLITLVDQQSLYTLVDTCLKVNRVYAECGIELPLNDENNNASVFTPTDGIIQIPTTKITQPGMKVAVIYQVKHAKLDPAVPTDMIVLPTPLEDAIAYYVASKVFSDMVGQENIVKSQELNAQYEASCKLVEEYDLLNNSMSTTIIREFERKGWV